MNMKALILLVLLCSFACFASPLKSAADPQKKLLDLKSQFDDVARRSGDEKPWQRKPESMNQRTLQDSLQQVADKLVIESQSNSEIVQMLQARQNHDGYARQALCRAILNARSYSKEDLPFLKDAFLASLNFRPEDYPPHLRNWLTPAIFREKLAGKIFRITGQGDLINSSDRRLLASDPKVWLEKYGR
jgi:hypothetical protein